MTKSCPMFSGSDARRAGFPAQLPRVERPAALPVLTRVPLLPAESALFPPADGYMPPHRPHSPSASTRTIQLHVHARFVGAHGPRHTLSRHSSHSCYERPHLLASWTSSFCCSRMFERACRRPIGFVQVDWNGNIGSAGQPEPLDQCIDRRDHDERQDGRGDHTADPVPVLHRIGIRPAMMATTVIILGRTRSTAPSMMAAFRSVRVKVLPSASRSAWISFMAWSR